MDSKEIEELKKQNNRLKLELDKIEEKRKKKKKFIFNGFKKAGILFIGRDLKNSIKDFIDNYNQNKKIDTESFSNMLTHLIWRLTRIGVFAIIFGMLPSVLLIQQNFLIRKQNDKIDIQNNIIGEQNYLLESQRRANLQFELSEILNRLDNELNLGKDRLSESLRSRIIASTQSMKPYKIYENGKISSKKYSYERSMLFVTLLNSKLNIYDLYTIFENADFSGMFLEDVTVEFLSKDRNFTPSMLFFFKDCYFKNVKILGLSTPSLIFENCIIDGFCNTSNEHDSVYSYEILNSTIKNMDFDSKVSEIKIINSEIILSNFSFLNTELFNKNNVTFEFIGRNTFKSNTIKNKNVSFQFDKKSSSKIDSIYFINSKLLTHEIGNKNNLFELKTNNLFFKRINTKTKEHKVIKQFTPVFNLIDDFNEKNVNSLKKSTTKDSVFK